MKFSRGFSGFFESDMDFIDIPNSEKLNLSDETLIRIQVIEEHLEEYLKLDKTMSKRMYDSEQSMMESQFSSSLGKIHGFRRKPFHYEPYGEMKKYQPYIDKIKNIKLRLSFDFFIGEQEQNFKEISEEIKTVINEIQKDKNFKFHVDNSVKTIMANREAIQANLNKK